MACRLRATPRFRRQSPSASAGRDASRRCAAARRWAWGLGPRGRGGIGRSAEGRFLTLSLVGVISLGLALANLLPIPALDGGRLLFVLFEAIFRRRVSPRYE